MSKRDRAMEKEHEQPERWWWLSFAEHGFLGVAIVRSCGFLHAVQAAWDMGINPGGEVKGSPLTGRPKDESWLNRLLTAEEVDEVNADATEWVRDWWVQ